MNNRGAQEQIRRVLNKNWLFMPNFISISEEIQILDEINIIMRDQKWCEDHFDSIVTNYRETVRSNIKDFKVLSNIVNNRIRPKFEYFGKTMMPIHCLELSTASRIKKHIDNPEVLFHVRNHSDLSFLVH